MHPQRPLRRKIKLDLSTFFYFIFLKEYSYHLQTVPEATATSTLDTQLHLPEPPLEPSRQPSPPKIVNSLPPEAKKDEPPPKAPSPVRTYSRQTRQASIGVKRTIAAVMSGSRSLQKKRELEVILLL